jgi:predicted PurR-regulated permease PerM
MVRQEKAHFQHILPAAFVFIAALHFAAEVLIPLALAVLFSFLLAPLVSRLEVIGFRRSLAVLLTTAITFALIGALTWVAMTQLRDLAERLPAYKDNVKARVHACCGLPAHPGNRNGAKSRD